MAGLVDYIAGGDRSPYIVKTLHDHEAFSETEQREIAILEAEAKTPISLPAPVDVERVVRDFDAHLKKDPEGAQEQMRRWLKDGTIRVGPREDGKIVAEGDLLPLFVVESSQTPKRNLPATNSMITGRYTIVAGASFPVRTPGKHSGFRSKQSRNATLEKDLALLDWLVERAIETLIPPTNPSHALPLLDSLTRPDEVPLSTTKRRRWIS